MDLVTVQLSWSVASGGQLVCAALGPLCSVETTRYGPMEGTAPPPELTRVREDLDATGLTAYLHAALPPGIGEDPFVPARQEHRAPADSVPARLGGVLDLQVRTIGQTTWWQTWWVVGGQWWQVTTEGEERVHRPCTRREVEVMLGQAVTHAWLRSERLTGAGQR